MSSVQLKAQNIKCAGCVANIKNGLTEIAGIDSIDVDIDSGTINVEGSALDSSAITSKLTTLGYPVVQD